MILKKNNINKNKGEKTVNLTKKKTIIYRADSMNNLQFTMYNDLQ